MSTVQGVSTQDINAYNQQQIQDFTEGKINITKSDLQSLVSSEIAQGQQPSGQLMDIIDSYDQIDKNGDGISYSDLQTYQNTPKGILDSLGLNSQTLNLQNNLLSLNILNADDSTNDSSSDLTSLLGNSSSSQTSSDDLSSLLLNNLTDSNDSSSLSSNDLTGLLGNSSSTSSYIGSLLQNYSSSNNNTADNNSLSLIDYLS